MFAHPSGLGFQPVSGPDSSAPQASYPESRGAHVSPQSGRDLFVIQVRHVGLVGGEALDHRERSLGVQLAEVALELDWGHLAPYQV